MRDISKARIVCIGDLMLDRFVAGTVTRISPEAPVPIFRWADERTMLGGVGNVVANLRSLGVKTELVGRIGRDAAGESIGSLVKGLGVSTQSLVVSSAVPTTEKSRFVSKGHHVLRMDRETVVPLTAGEVRKLEVSVRRLLKTTDLVILSDYAKGFLSDDVTQRLIALCRAAAVPVFVDPKGNDYQKYAHADLVKPNLRELEIVSGVRLDPSSADFLDAVASTARALLKKIRVRAALVTLSERGMIYVSAEKKTKPQYLPTEVREVSDVSGAGDTTIAVLAAATAAGAPVTEAMRMANAAAGLVVSKVGTATVTMSELKAVMLPAGKTLSRASLVEQVRAWQAAGLRVGFTNGCFDCLHCGHLSSLEEAKAHCDRLVVAVNSDDSVRRLKGPTRPIQDEKTRMSVLGALEVVDAVTVFDEDTALPLVKAVRPDVIAKEGYALKNWPEARFVRSHGGIAVTLKRLNGYSTTEIMKKAGGRA